VTDILMIAAAHRDRLQGEIAKIEQFIRMAEKLSREPAKSGLDLLASAAPSRPAMAAAAPVPASMPVTRAETAPAAKEARDERPLVLPASRMSAPAASHRPAAETLPAVMRPAAVPAVYQTRGSLFRGACSSSDELRRAVAG